ncbi:MAG: hypothetical protein J6U54_13855 [Clostridiales bacterium]|nr:hypothetical protein [Clostridiales bacterium]
MSFLDNLKAAMERGAKAANDYCEREKAAKPVPTAKPVQRVNTDPSAPFKFAVKNESPIIVTDPITDEQIVFKLLADGRAKLDDPSDYEGKDYKKILRDTVIEIVTEKMNDPFFLSNPKDLKTLLLAQNRMRTTVTTELKAKGFTAVFRILNITPVRDNLPECT